MKELSIEDMVKEIALRKALLIEEAKEDVLHFTYATMPTFKPAEFHKNYYNLLTKFAHKEIKKMMVFMPPQHGKSEGSTRRLPSFLLGDNPEDRIAIVCYNATKARKFNREIQRIIDSEEYRKIFPNTTLVGQNAIKDSTNFIRTAEEFEVVGHRGGLKAVGVGGALTGDPVDILIMDDLYKDALTAWSPVYRERVNDWYDTTAETRLHNDSQQLIVFTRWHEDDLAGRLLKQQGIYDPIKNPDGWVVCTYKAIKEGAPTDYDDRQEGEALWEQRHSKQKLESIRKKNPFVFESLYQQNPKPAEGLMYGKFKTYDTMPATLKHELKAYVDTADTGSDYLCAILYNETEIGNFIIDIMYTQKPMEYTEPELAKMLTKHQINQVNVESNNGGKGFARNVENQMRILGNSKTKVKWFAQTQNKDVRIFVHSADVQNLTYFPSHWITTYPEFSTAIINYLKMGKNAHDDAPDALTGTIEMRNKGKKVNVAGAFGIRN